MKIKQKMKIVNIEMELLSTHLTSFKYRNVHFIHTYMCLHLSCVCVVGIQYGQYVVYRIKSITLYSSYNKQHLLAPISCECMSLNMNVYFELFKYSLFNIVHSVQLLCVCSLFKCFALLFYSFKQALSNEFTIFFLSITCIMY